MGRWVATTERVSLRQTPEDNFILKSIKPINKDEGRIQETRALRHVP